MITLDTSGFLALLNTRDQNHAACLDEFERDRGPYLLSTAALAEIAWFLESRFRNASAEDAFLADLRDGVYDLHWEMRDIERIRELIHKYGDLDLGFTDAAVMTCAERHGGRVLSTDRRFFSVVARGEGTITVVPESAT